jgi:hypothetical protein
MDELQELINWLSTKVRDLRREESSIREHPGAPSNREWLKKLDDVRAEIEKLSTLRSKVAARDYPAIDEARTMKADAEDAATKELAIAERRAVNANAGEDVG